MRWIQTNFRYLTRLCLLLQLCCTVNMIISYFNQTMCQSEHIICTSLVCPQHPRSDTMKREGDFSVVGQDVYSPPYAAATKRIADNRWSFPITGWQAERVRATVWASNDSNRIRICGETLILRKVTHREVSHGKTQFADVTVGTSGVVFQRRSTPVLTGEIELVIVEFTDTARQILQTFLNYDFVNKLYTLFYRVYCEATSSEAIQSEFYVWRTAITVIAENSEKRTCLSWVFCEFLDTGRLFILLGTPPQWIQGASVCERSSWSCYKNIVWTLYLLLERTLNWLFSVYIIFVSWHVHPNGKRIQK